MKKSLRDLVVKTPILGRVALIAKNLINLPELHKLQLANSSQTNEQYEKLLTIVNSHFELTNQLIDKLSDRLADIESTQDDLQNSLKSPHQNKQIISSDDLFADDHIMDKFYTSFEDRFRGSEEMITEFQKEYLPYFKNSKLDFKKTPVLDIGSGRGEFLQLLKDNKIRGIGLDINIDMVKRSKAKDLEAELGDALSFLKTKSTNSFGAITGFHIAEHIPFNILMRIFRNIHRTLTKDGFIIFETPNPENVIVGTHNFYMDPSHLHPLPPVLLAFALETSGFRNVEILRLHPDKAPADVKLSKDIENRFYGPRDYAVIGYK